MKNLKQKMKKKIEPIKKVQVIATMLLFIFALNIIPMPGAKGAEVVSKADTSSGKLEQLNKPTVETIKTDEFSMINSLAFTNNPEDKTKFEVTGNFELFKEPTQKFNTGDKNSPNYITPMTKPSKENGFLHAFPRLKEHLPVYLYSKFKAESTGFNAYIEKKDVENAEINHVFQESGTYTGADGKRHGINVTRRIFNIVPTISPVDMAGMPIDFDGSAFSISNNLESGFQKMNTQLVAMGIKFTDEETGETMNPKDAKISISSLNGTPTDGEFVAYLNQDKGLKTYLTDDTNVIQDKLNILDNGANAKNIDKDVVIFRGASNDFIDELGGKTFNRNAVTFDLGTAEEHIFLVGNTSNDGSVVGSGWMAQSSYTNAKTKPLPPKKYILDEGGKQVEESTVEKGGTIDYQIIPDLPAQASAIYKIFRTEDILSDKVEFVSGEVTINGKKYENADIKYDKATRKVVFDGSNEELLGKFVEDNRENGLLQYDGKDEMIVSIKVKALETLNKNDVIKNVGKVIIDDLEQNTNEVTTVPKIKVPPVKTTKYVNGQQDLEIDYDKEFNFTVDANIEEIVKDLEGTTELGFKDVISPDFDFDVSNAKLHILDEITPMKNETTEVEVKDKEESEVKETKKDTEKDKKEESKETDKKEETKATDPTKPTEEQKDGIEIKVVDGELIAAIKDMKLLEGKKQLRLEIPAKVKPGVDLSKYEDGKIPNTARFYRIKDGEPIEDESNKVTVKPSNKPVGNVETDFTTEKGEKKINPLYGYSLVDKVKITDEGLFANSLKDDKAYVKTRYAIVPLNVKDNEITEENAKFIGETTTEVDVKPKEVTEFETKLSIKENEVKTGEKLVATHVFYSDKEMKNEVKKHVNFADERQTLATADVEPLTKTNTEEMTPKKKFPLTATITVGAVALGAGLYLAFRKKQPIK